MEKEIWIKECEIVILYIYIYTLTHHAFVPLKKIGLVDFGLLMTLTFLNVLYNRAHCLSLKREMGHLVVQSWPGSQELEKRLTF